MTYRLGQTKIYFIILSLILLATLMFIFRDLVFARLETLLVHDPSMTVGSSVPRQTMIDLSILENNQLQRMSNHVSFFDFNHLGRIAPSNLDTSNLPIFNPVYLGNNRPFDAPRIIINEETSNP